MGKHQGILQRAHGEETEQILRDPNPSTRTFFQDVVLDYGQATAVRWQAVLYVKNGIDKYWRKMAPK